MPTDDREPGEAAGTRLRNLTLLLGSTLTVMAGATIAPALPAMRAAFPDVANAEFLVKLLLTVPALLIAVAAPLFGLLLDRWGRRPVLIFGLLLYGVAGSSGLYLQTLPALLVGRALLGVAVAAIMTACTTLIGDVFSGSRLHAFMGKQAAFMGFGGVIFLVAGGVLADIGWRYPFLVYLFAFLVLPGALLAIVEPGIGARGRHDGFADALVPSGSRPLASLAAAYLLAWVVMVVFYMIPVQVPFLIEGMGIVGNARVGVAIAGMNLFAAVSSLSYGRWRARLGFGRIFVVTLALVGLGFLVIGTSDSYPRIIVGLVISGAGLGALMPNLNAWVVSFTPARLRGRAIGGLTSFFFLGQFFSPLISRPIDQRLGIGGGFLAAGFALFLLAMVVFLVGIRRERRQPSPGA